MPSLWELMPPLVQQRVEYPPLEYATPIEVAQEVYDVMGQVLSSQIPLTPNIAVGSVVIDASGLRLFNAGKNTIYLDVDGDAFFGSDLGDAATTSLVILNNDQAYNGEELGEGDILLGDNSSSQANILWDRSAGIIYFRGGTTNQVYIDTTGALTAGAGSVVLDDGGIKLDTSTIQVDAATIRWFDDIVAETTKTAEAYAVIVGSGTNYSGLFNLNSYAQTAGRTATISLEAIATGATTNNARIQINAAISGGSNIQINAGTADVDTVINGSAALVNLCKFDAGVNSIGIGTGTFDATGRQVLVFDNGTAPAASVTDAAQLWVADVAAGNSDFRMRTEGGTVGRIFNVVTAVSHDATQTITTSTTTNLVWNTELVDDEGWHSIVANTDRVTVTEAGEYLATAYIEWDADPTGQRLLRIRDSAGNVWALVRDLGETGISTAQSVTGERTLAAGAYVFVDVFQSSGANRTISTFPRFTLIKLR